MVNIMLKRLRFPIELSKKIVKTSEFNTEIFSASWAAETSSVKYEFSLKGMMW